MNSLGEGKMPCIRCGECLAVCPAGISPLRLFALWQEGNVAGMSLESLESCVFCRKCDSVCPSQLPLADSFITAREDAEEMNRKRDNARRLQLRHEAHVRRMSALARPGRFAKLDPSKLAAKARKRASEVAAS